MEEMKRTTNAFHYVFERNLKAGETVLVKVPRVSANKRGVGDIGWQTDGNVTVYATLASHPSAASTLWQELCPNDDVNHTVSAFKIQNNGEVCRVTVRVLLN